MKESCDGEAFEATRRRQCVTSAPANDEPSGRRARAARSIRIDEESGDHKRGEAGKRRRADDGRAATLLA